MSDILLFGLSADPVHLGHLNTIEFLNEKFPKHDIIIMPCKNNPIPKMQSQQTDGEIRLQMLQEIQNDKNVSYLKKNTTISNYEVLKSSPSYTIETVDYILAKYHPETLTIVLGTDNFEQFPKWKDFKRILELTHLLIIQRPGSKNDFQKLIQNYGYNIHILPNIPKELGNYHYDFIFIQATKKLYYVYDSDHLEEIPYNSQISQLIKSNKKNILHLDTSKSIKEFGEAKWPQLLQTKFKEGRIKEIIGPQLDISSSQIRHWFREGLFQNITKFLLPITYHSLRENFLHHSLSKDYFNTNKEIKSIPTVKELFK